MELRTHPILYPNVLLTSLEAWSTQDFARQWRFHHVAFAVNVFVLACRQDFILFVAQCRLRRSIHCSAT